MSEGKPLTIHEMVGIHDEFTTMLENIQNTVLRNVSKINIDSLRIVLLKKTLKSFLERMPKWKLEEVQKNTRISAHAKHKAMTKECTSVYGMITARKFQNILITTPHALNQSSNYKKYMLEAFGLHQPSKLLDSEVIDELKQLINRLEISEIDICIDSELPLDMNALKMFGRQTFYFSTCYINNPIGLSYITKICYYDKRVKDHLEKPCYRLELRCITKGKIGTLYIPYDEVIEVLIALRLS